MSVGVSVGLSVGLSVCVIVYGVSVARLVVFMHLPSFSADYCFSVCY